MPCVKYSTIQTIRQGDTMIKNRLAAIRAQKSAERGQVYSQTEFAKLLGMIIGQYNQYETHRREPTLETAWKIARILNCSIDELFEEIE